MGFETGILFAFLALIFWGFGDFLIQKSTRKFGDWETLFVISIFGTIILFPFIFKDLASLFPFNREFWILIGVSLIILFAAILDFEALKKGKLAVIEPVLALEVPVSVILAFVIIKENLSLIKSEDLIKFKQEQCILHVACQTLEDATDLVVKAQLTGWKRSSPWSGSPKLPGTK